MAVKTLNLKPLGDRIIIKALPQEEVTKGGVFIPDTAKEKPQQGEVLSVGQGCYDDNGKLIPMAVKTGNKVLYGKYSGTEIKLEGEEYLILSEKDVLAIVE